jgi:small ligand-binding sensory domain FIST
MQQNSMPGSGSLRSSITACASVVATSDWKLAIDLLDAEIGNAGTPPDVLIVFINDAWQPLYDDLLRELRQRSGARTIIGGSASGVLADGREHEDVPGISCLALWLPGVRATPLRLHQESLSMLHDPETWHAATGIDPAELGGILLFADPFRLDAHELLCGVRTCYPGVPVVGGMTSASQHRRQTWLFINEQVYDEGGIALLLDGPVTLCPIVSHGAEPVGEAWTITSVDHNCLLEISGRPALDVLLDTAQSVYGSGWRDSFPYGDWLIGFAVNEYQDRFHRGDFIVRGILGSDLARQGIIVGGVPRVGQTVQFQMRDPALADVDLRQHLIDVRADPEVRPAAALLFTCNGRGEDMFGEPNHDAGTVSTLLPGVPVAGMFCNGEFGPGGSRGTPVMHGFTATLGLLIPTERDETS